MSTINNVKPHFDINVCDLINCSDHYHLLICCAPFDGLVDAGGKVGRTLNLCTLVNSVCCRGKECVEIYPAVSYVFRV